MTAMVVAPTTTGGGARRPVPAPAPALPTQLGHPCAIRSPTCPALNLAQAEPGSKLALGRVLALKSGGQFKARGGGDGGSGGAAAAGASRPLHRPWGRGGGVSRLRPASQLTLLVASIPCRWVSPTWKVCAWRQRCWRR